MLRKIACCIFSVSIFVSALPLNNASAEMSFQEDLSVITYQVSGNRDRSSYPKDSTCFLNEGTLDYREEGEEGSLKQGRFLYRSTDDRLIDPEDLSIEYMFFNFRNKDTDILFGDSTVFFSEYSLGNSIKGLKTEFKTEDGAKIMFAAGVDTSAWDNLYKERADDGPTKRYVWGSRFEKSYLDADNLTIGWNYAGAADDRATFTEADTAKTVNVVSSDIRYKMNQIWALRGEIAKSFREASTGEGIVYDDKFDGAYSTAIDLMTEKYTSTLAYKRVGSNFETTGGFSAQDTESVQLNNSFKPTNRFSLNSFLYWNRDNIDKHKDTTLKQVSPGINFIADLVSGYLLRGGWNRRKEYGTDKSSNNMTDVFNTGLTKTIGPVSTSLDYSRSYIRDKINADQERNRDDVTLSLSGNANIRSADIAWYVVEVCGRERNLYYNDHDLLLSHTVGANMRFPRDFYLNASMTLGDNNYYQDENDSDTRRYEFSCYKKVSENLTVSLSYTQGDNMFIDDDNDFSEKKMVFKTSYKF